jgi:drug/metabolite transporter (DMT)-like permease
MSKYSTWSITFNSTTKLYIALVMAMFIWGISWPSAKIVGRYADADLLMFWRFVIGAMTMLPIMYLLKINANFPRKSFRYVLIAAICLVGYNYNYLKGTQIGMAGLGGVIVPTLSPLVTLILAIATFNQKVHKKDIIGILFGIIGGLILLEIWKFNFQDLSKSGNLYFIIAAVVWAGATICTQKAKSELNAVNFSLWLYLVAIIIVLPITPISSIMNVFSFDWIFWINFLVISALSLGFGTTIFFLATMNIGSHKTSSFMYVVPISAVGSSVLFLGEPLALSTTLGGGLAIFGVYLINQK